MAAVGIGGYGFVAFGRDDNDAISAPNVSDAPDAPAEPAAAAPSGSSAIEGGTPSIPAGEDTVVESITDGDTLRVQGGTRVRLIGIDTPELAGTGECYAVEAATHLSELTPPGTPVRLVADVGRTDRYGRTLSYVYRLGDGLFVNLAMAADGYAVQLTVPPNVAHVEDISGAVAEARDADRGLWAACPAAESPVATPSPPAVEPLVPPSPRECDPAYPAFCVPPGPPDGPDLDCGDVARTRFQVEAPDPHGFDGDHDGLGCE
ncbi:MAG: thermonuclease family protein [Acidimicrobiales bacterium]